MCDNVGDQTERANSDGVTGEVVDATSQKRKAKEDATSVLAENVIAKRMRKSAPKKEPKKAKAVSAEKKARGASAQKNSHSMKQMNDLAGVLYSFHMPQLPSLFEFEGKYTPKPTSRTDESLVFLEVLDENFSRESWKLQSNIYRNLHFETRLDELRFHIEIHDFLARILFCVDSISEEQRSMLIDRFFFQNADFVQRFVSRI